MRFTPRYTGVETSDGVLRDRFEIAADMQFGEAWAPQIKFEEQTSSGTMTFNRSMHVVDQCAWKVDAELLFNGGEAKGRMILSSDSTFQPKSAENGQ
jgi:hypothetical protein